MTLSKLISFQEFLERCEESHSEWVDGQVVAMSPVDAEHDELTTFLIQLIGLFVQAKGLGTIHKEPFLMRTGPDLPARSPDLLFLAAEHRGRLERTYLNGPADLAIEVVSRESRTRDRGEKFYEYEQGGVREYWLIDPLRTQAEFYGLSPEGRFTLLPVSSGKFESPVLTGLSIEVGWFWQKPLPAVLELAKELGLL